jgi:prophage DNA circulation protein
MSEDEQRKLFALREELRLSAVLEGARRFAAKFDVMQREARRAAMKLTLGRVAAQRSSGRGRHGR